MSGWVKSRPVSTSPTTTAGLPPLTACACGALIWRMSHCRPERLSLSVAGALPGSGQAAVSSTAPPSARTPSPPVPAAPRVPKLRRERIATTAPPSLERPPGLRGPGAAATGPLGLPSEGNQDSREKRQLAETTARWCEAMGRRDRGEGARLPPLPRRADHLDGLQGAVGNVPPGEHAVVAAVRDRLPQGGAQRLAQRRVLLAHADAERPGVDLLAHHLEVPAGVGHLGVVGGDREIGEGGVRVPVFHLEQRLAARVERPHLHRLAGRA